VKSNVHYRTSVLTTALATFATAGALAEAPSPASEPAPTVNVRYAGLDLSTAAGAALLYQRLKGAARQVCAGFESRQLALQVEWRGCYETALGNAVRQVNRPELSALYRTEHRNTATG
jgi:UrcA family protein